MQTSTCTPILVVLTTFNSLSFTTMAKMNLDFLLSPDSSSTRMEISSAGHSSRGESPFSLDYIAPRNNTPDNRRYRDHHNHHRRSPDQPLRLPPGTSSKISSRDQLQSSLPARPAFKAKKPKNPTSPSTQRPTSTAEVKPHACPQCERSFYKLEQLKRHDRLVHLNLRPFVCKTCDLSFGTKQNMQVHLTTRKHRHRLQTLQANGRSSHGNSSSHHH